MYESRDNGDFKMVGKTSVDKKTRNPEFPGMFRLEYCFEMTQNLKFVVKDENHSSKPLIGEKTLLMSDLVRSRNEYIKEPLENGKDSGEIIVYCEEIEKTDPSVTYVSRHSTRTYLK